MGTEYLTIDFNVLKDYATFESKREMDDNIYEHIECLLGEEVPMSVIEVLRFFGRSSLRVAGVSFAKYETIAEKIGYSLSTIKRAVKALKEHGIIEVIPTTCKWGSYGTSRKKSVNVVRILPFMTPQNDTAVEVEECPSDNVTSDKKQSEPISSKHTQELLHNTSTSPYTRFKSLIDDKKLRNKIYGIWLAHTRYLKGVYDDSLLLQTGIRAVMVAFKSDNVRNITGYYNGVLDKMFDQLYDDMMMGMLED